MEHELPKPTNNYSWCWSLCAKPLTFLLEIRQPFTLNVWVKTNTNVHVNTSILFALKKKKSVFFLKKNTPVKVLKLSMPTKTHCNQIDLWPTSDKISNGTYKTKFAPFAYKTQFHAHKNIIVATINYLRGFYCRSNDQNYCVFLRK